MRTVVLLLSLAVVGASPGALAADPPMTVFSLCTEADSCRQHVHQMEMKMVPLEMYRKRGQLNAEATKELQVMSGEYQRVLTHACFTLKAKEICGVLKACKFAIDVNECLRGFDAYCTSESAPGCKGYDRRRLADEAPKPVVVDDADVAATLALLKKQGHLRGADLSNKRLQGINLSKADLSKANLTRANLSFSTLEGTKFVGATLDDVQFGLQVQMDEVDFTGASLKAAKLHGLGNRILVKDADFTGARLGGTFENVDFRTARLDEADVTITCRYCNFAGVDLSRVKRLDKSTFERSNLQKAKLAGVSLLGASFEGCNLRDADFEGANAKRSSWKENDLRGANMGSMQFDTKASTSLERGDNKR